MPARDRKDQRAVPTDPTAQGGLGHICIYSMVAVQRLTGRTVAYNTAYCRQLHTLSCICICNFAVYLWTTVALNTNSTS